MQVTIVNRLKNADNKIIQDVNVQLPELIFALWRTQPSKVGTFFSKAPKKAPTPGHIQQILNTAILNVQSLKLKGPYGKRLAGVELWSNNKVFWANLIIDEKQYFEYHSKKDLNLIDGLVNTYSTPIRPAPPVNTPPAAPEVRPPDEVNPVYPAMSINVEEPGKEAPTHSDKNKILRIRVMAHVLIGLAITLGCMGLGISGVVTLAALLVTSLVVFLATNHFQSKPKKPFVERTIPDTPRPLSPYPLTPFTQFPVPDNLSILFSRRNSTPKNTSNAPISEPIKDESFTPKKMAK